MIFYKAVKKSRLFFLAVLFSIFFACSPDTAAAKDEWRQVRSKNFNLVGNAGEKDICKAAFKLEQFREAFRQIFNKFNFNSSIPTNVIVFKNGSAYKPFKPKRADGKTDDFIAGYFQAGEDVNYITLSTEGDDAETYGTIFHEYVHFIIDANFGSSEVPPWFNEGLAEYYQTFAIENDRQAKLGLAQNGHLRLLRQNRLIPLEMLFKVSNYALHQNENHSRGIFYAQSWALIHYLMQNGKSDGLGKFLTLTMKDVPSEKAFHEAFQMTYAQMESELQKYVGQNSYKYTLVTFKDKLTFDGEMRASAMSEADANAYLGDLLFHTNRLEEAEFYLQKALALAPDSSMTNTTYGMIKLRQNKFDEAKNYFEKAVSRGQLNYIALYRYAFLLSREEVDAFGYVKSYPADKSAKMRGLLKKAIAANPDFTESYELLAFVNLVNNEELDEAVAYLQKAVQIQPGNQRYALRIGEIYMRQQKLAEAAAIAEKAAAAGDPQIKTQAENLTDRIRRTREMLAHQPNPRRQNKSSRIISDEIPLPPEEIAKIEQEERMRSINQSLGKPAAGEKRVIGRIQKIDCKDKAVIYTVQTEDETFALTSGNFEKLKLIAYVAGLENTEIGCGADLAAIKSVLTYKPQIGAKSGSRGELTAIDFIPEDFVFVELDENSDEVRKE